MKKIYWLICIIAAVSTFGCANLSDKNSEQPFVTTIIDIQEANYVRKCLDADPNLKGTYQVRPGPQVTTVRFTSPDTPGNEATLRNYMQEIKKVLTKNRTRTANTIKFIFPKVTIEE